MKQLSNYGIVLLFGALLLSPLSIWAQEQVSGTVTDENGAPLPGATVLVEETNQGTTTDFDGNYQINAAQGQTLVFSYVGYESQKVNVNSFNVNINLTESGLLDEVIVNALGLEKKKDNDLSSSSIVKVDEIQRSGEAGVLQALSGKTSGINITRSAGDPDLSGQR